MNADEPTPGDPELEALLRRVPPERADPRRREEARRAFLSSDPGSERAASRGAGADRMGRVMQADEHDGFVAWLAARAPADPARPEARRRARLAFLSLLAASAPLPRRQRRSFRALVLTLAAAAILAVTFLLPEPERWSVRLDGPLTFAGREYVPGEDARLAADLEGSGTLESAASGARFTLGSGELVLELLPGASLSFPPLPELDGLASVRFELTRGEAYLRTSASYPGNPIVVLTPLAEVALAGTVVGVLVDEAGTCVCVAQGSVNVTSTRLAGRRALEARATLRVFDDPGMGAKLEAFPEDDGDEAEHTRPLVEFGKGR